MVIALSVPAYILICYIIGHFDEKSEFWQMENNLNYRVTPYSDEMLNHIREIRKNLNKLLGSFFLRMTVPSGK